MSEGSQNPSTPLSGRKSAAQLHAVGMPARRLVHGPSLLVVFLCIAAVHPPAAAQKKPLDRGQSTTLSTMSRIGKGLKSWASQEAGDGRYEYAGADTGETWQVRMKESEPPRTLHVVSYETVTEILKPYLPELRDVDGWGHPLQFAIGRDLRGEGVFAIRSPGRDGRFDTDSYVPGSFDAKDLDGDIVAVDGYFFRWPQHVPEKMAVAIRASLPDFALPPEQEKGEGTLRILRSRDSREVARLPLRIPGETSVELEKEESWWLEVDSDRYWHEGTYVQELSDEILLVLRPFVDVRGRFEAPEGVALPTQVYLRFEAPDADPEVRLPHHLVECPVADQAWSCRVPAGLWNVRVGILDFAPVFLSGLDLRGTAEKDLGTISLPSECSIHGWVRTDSDEPLPSGVRVELLALQEKGRPVSNTVGGRRELVAKEGTQPVEQGVDENGFFQFTGLVESEIYSITPKRDGWAGIEHGFFTESYMCQNKAEVILHLSRELVLDARLTTAAGLEWTLSLLHASSFREPGVTATCDAAGECGRISGLVPGLYSLRAIDALGNEASTLPIELRPGQETLDVELPVRPVLGTVTWRGAPLPAEVDFSTWDFPEELDGPSPPRPNARPRVAVGAVRRLGGSTPHIRIKMADRGEGRFAGWLPRMWNEWYVRVHAHDGTVFQVLGPLECRPEDPVLQFDLEIPDAEP